ncbi:MEP2 [[Candida] subhashii]|uniref:Ammonium transporter n=1 Tax=[Candida] subhashii TaxID=561895 RepID=A0A8J5QJG0_9ASCO|nr:MEP2 [[Candida] subhashii]KAG7661942.1 MEP2 [[Candida] subhashii]
MSDSGLTGTGTGGDVFKVNLNEQFQGADMAWVGISSALVWLMIPGVGLLYSGIARKKHALSLLWASLMAACVTGVQWFFWGYSLSFCHDGSSFIGTLQNIGLKDVLGAPSVVSTIPDILLCLYQGMFAGVTGVLMVGAGCERARLFPMMIFLFIWLTVVYCPIAYWAWNPKGWLATLGSLDYAGGGPVHENSGFAALAYSLWLGKRHDPLTKSKVPKYKPHSVTSIVMGTVFLWFGWFGFNGGSTGDASIRAWYACVNTNLAAATGGLTWMFIDYFRTGGKWSMVGGCCGALSGLVAITPGAGYTHVAFSLVYGVVGATVCNFAVDLKDIIGIDDGMDVFALHGVGGFAGNLLTGIFAADYIAMIDGVKIDGGWINHHWVQLGYQLTSSVSIGAYSFVVTSILLLVMDKIPQLRIRLHEDEELLGTDLAEIGELVYEDGDDVSSDHRAFVLEPIRSTKPVGSNQNKEQSMPAIDGVSVPDHGSDVSNDNISKN